MSNIKFEYSPTNWNSATRITPERLNKMENGFVQLATTLATVGKEITLLKEQIVSLQGSMQLWQQTTQNDIIKDMRQELKALDDQMNKRFLNIDDKIEGVIEAGAQAGATSANNFVRDKGYDIDVIKNWRVQKDKDDEARDSRLNLNDDWKSDYSNWRAENTATTKDLKTNLEAQTASIHEMTLIVGDAKTAAETAVTKATNAENTAANTAVSVENNIWGANKNFEKNFNDLLNSENTRSIINKNAKIAIGRTFGMNPSDDDDINTETLKNSLKAATTNSVSELGFAKADDVNAAITNTEERLNKATNQKLGTAFGMVVNEDDDVDMTALQTQLQNFAGSTLLTANIITDTTEGNQTLTQWLNNKQTAENDSFSAIINTLNQLTQDVADIKTKFNQHASNSTAHTSAGNLFEQVSTPGKVVYTPIGGFTPTITGKK